MRRALTGAGVSLAIVTAAAGAAAAVRARSDQHPVSAAHIQHIARLQMYLTDVMNNPDRTQEQARITEILDSLQLPTVMTSSEGSEFQLPKWQQLLVRLGSLSGGQPSLDFLGRFLDKFTPAGLSAAELALAVGSIINSAMQAYDPANPSPLPADQAAIIDEFDRRVRAAVQQPSAQPGDLRAILDHLAGKLTQVRDQDGRTLEPADPGLRMVGGQSLGEHLRGRLQELLPGRLDPVRSSALEATILDIAGEAGKHGL